MDVGFGDDVYPAPAEVTFPTLLDFSPPHVHIYPQETVVAEKLQAWLERGGQSSRMKDLFDLWGIHCSVIAPSLIPTKPGENKKCDRLDAQKLARYLSTGLLTEIRVPAADEEAARAWYDTASQ